MWQSDKNVNICGNCGRTLEKGDRYCRVCGTLAGEGKYIPNRDTMACIYGPRPIRRRHTCLNCGYVWDNIQMIDRDKYCPRCRGEIQVEKLEEN